MTTLGLNLNYDKNFEKKNTSQHLLNVQDHECWKNVICCINDIKVFFSRKAYHKVEIEKGADLNHLCVKIQFMI